MEGASATFPTIADRPIWDRRITGKALHDLLSREWIDRVWTFQEVLLSPVPVVCCGTKMIQWRSILISLLFLDKFRWMFARGSPSPLLTAWTGMAKLWRGIHQGDNIFLQTSAQAGESLVNASYLEKDYFTFIDRVYRYYEIIWIFSCCLIIIPLAVCVLCGRILEYIFSHLRSQPALIVGAIPIFIVMIFTINPCLATILVIWTTTHRQTWADPYDIRRVFVNEIQQRKTTEARDKSFGIHSILSELGVMLTPPDYSRSIEQVFKELFVSLLTWTDSIEMLMCNIGRKSGRLCSWVPDWRIETKRDSMNAAYLLGTTGYWSQPMNQDNQPEFQHFTLRSHDELVLYGKPIAQISSCMGNFERTSDQYQDEEKLVHIRNMQILQRLISRLRSRKWSILSFHSMLWSSESAVCQRLRDVVPMQNPSQISSTLRRSQPLLGGVLGASAESVFDMFRSRMRYFAWWRFPPRIIDEYADCVCWVNERADDGCSFFFTKVDSLVYGPESAMVDDLILLVCGVSLPIVLRPMGDRYRLVGFAYVEDVDVKKFWRNLRPDELQEIVLF